MLTVQQIYGKYWSGVCVFVCWIQERRVWTRAVQPLCVRNRVHRDSIWHSTSTAVKPATAMIPAR